MKVYTSTLLALLAVVPGNAQTEVPCDGGRPGPCWLTHGVTTKLEDLFTPDELMTVTVIPDGQAPAPLVPDHYEVGVFRSQVSLITPFSVTTFPLDLVSCGHLRQEEAPDNYPNPTLFAFDDPLDPTKDCLLDAKTLVLSLPLGIGYRAGSRVCSAANVCGPWSLLTNTFRRAPRGIPCPGGVGVQSTVDVDIDGQPVHVTICVQR